MIVIGLFLVEGLDDFRYQRVSHNVFVAEENCGDALYVLEEIYALEKT